MSVLGTWFGVKCRSWKSPSKNTSLQAPIPTWRPPVWFLGSERGPIGSQNPWIYETKWKLGMHTLTFEIPRWSRDGPRLPNSLKMAPKLTQNMFRDSFSMNYAMLSGNSSMAKNKWSNTNQVMPTSTKKTHTTQRGVGGMRRRPGKFWVHPALLGSVWQNA